MTLSSKNKPLPQEKVQPLVEHLLELRTRLIRCMLAVAIIFIALFAFSNDIYSFISKPLYSLLDNSTMIATDVTSPFLTPFKLTLFVSLFAAMPYLLSQLRGFISPALYHHEKRIAVPLFIASVSLFYLGIVFAYYVVFPLAFKFFTAAAPENVAVMTDIAEYLRFVIKLFFAFGFAFQIPIATFLLIRTGATTAEALKEKRPYIIVACFIIGMLLTPPDIISQALLALPMWALFEIGLLFAKVLGAKPAKHTAEADNRTDGSNPDQ